MPKHDYEDYDDDGDYDDDYEETMQYVKKVKLQLKLPKVTDAQIIRKLEDTDYDIGKTVKFFKDKEAKNQPAGVKGGGGTGGKAPASQPKVIQSTVATKLSPANPVESSKVNEKLVDLTIDAPSNSELSTVFHVSTKGDLVLSDDEDVIIASRVKASTEAVPAKYVSTDGLPQLTMVVTGHVDAGKSTLVGHLLYKCGQVAQRTMHKYEKDSKNIGKASFALAWVTDDSKAEREHGVTIDVSERQLVTERRLVTVLDTPGHRDFIPNMIKGAAQADVALLVVPATEGEFESSMKDNAQTREHATLLKALGVSQVIVVINKMDNTTPTAWSADRCHVIESAIRTLLCDEMQFHSQHVRIVPLSGLTGQNIVALDEDCPLKSWYTGPTLLQAIDSFIVPTRGVDRPLRAVVHEVVSADLNRGRYELEVSVLQGKLASEHTLGFFDLATVPLNPGPLATHSPMLASVTSAASAVSGVKSGTSDTPVVVKSTKYQVGTGVVTSSIGGVTAMGANDTYKSVTLLKAGERGTITVTSKYWKGVDVGLREGSVLFKGPGLPQQCYGFKTTISTMAHMQVPIIPGACFELYLHGTEAQCRVTKLHSIVNAAAPSSAPTVSDNVVPVVKTVPKRPKCIPGGVQAVVSVTVDAPILLEPFKSCRALGRFALRSKGKTIAVGVCDKIE